MLKVVNVATGAVVAAYAVEVQRPEPENESPTGLDARTKLNQKITERNKQRNKEAMYAAAELNRNSTEGGAYYLVLDTGVNDFLGEPVECHS